MRRSLLLAGGALAAVWLVACGAEPRQAVPGPAEPESTRAEVASAPPHAPAEVALFAAAPAGRLRGRVLDAATGEPWREVWVRLDGGGEGDLVRTTDTGHFIAEAELSGGPVEVRVGLDPDGPWAQDQPVVLEHEPARAAEVAHELAVPAGPSFTLDFLEQAAEEPERWEARLVELGPGVRRRPWSWRVLRAGDPPRLRYPRLEHAPEEAWRPFVELRLRQKDWFARAPVDRALGQHPEPLPLELVQGSVYGGRLVDEGGRPVASAQLDLRPLGGGPLPLLDDRPRLAWSDAQGRFELGGPEQGGYLEPGVHHLVVRSEGRETLRLDLELEAGDRSGHELRLREVAAELSLPVAVRGPEGGPPPEVLVALDGLDLPLRRALHTRATDPALGLVRRAGLGWAMLFEDLPAGRYRVEVLGLDGRPYEPRSVEVRLPGDEGAAFAQVAGPAPRVLRFEPRAAGETAQPPEYFLRLAGEGWWSPEATRVRRGHGMGSVVPGAGIDRWRVWVAGCLPRWGRIDELAEPGGEALALELEAGWGAELLVLDASRGLPSPELDSWSLTAFAHQAAPVEGALVIADGRLVGQSDAAGRVRLELDALPERLEVWKDGWRARGPGDGTEVLADLRRLDMLRGAFVWLEPAR